MPGKDGKEVKLREVYGVIVSCPTRFRDVGDTAIQADPGYAAVPWAIVRLCLTAGINEHEMYGVMIQGLELVSGLVTYYIMIERIFADEHSDFVRAVQKLLLALYAAILDFLLEALSYFPPLHRDEDEKPWFRHKMKSGASKIKRTLRSLDPTVKASVKSLPTQVSSAKDNVDADANHAYATMNIQVMDELGNTQNHILKQLEDIGLNEEERDRRLRVILKEFLRGGNQASINHVSTPLERLQRRLVPHRHPWPQRLALLRLTRLQILCRDPPPRRLRRQPSQPHIPMPHRRSALPCLPEPAELGPSIHALARRDVQGLSGHCTCLVI